MEGVSLDTTPRPNHRPWHEQHEPHAAARAWARRAESLYPPDAGPTRRHDRRQAHRLVESERLFQWRHDAGDGRRGHHLHPRPDGFRHYFALEDAGWVAGPAALSGRNGRHGPASGTDEDAHRDRDSLARLRVGVG